MARYGMLIHGDCLDVLPTLPDASVDMVFADLPYGVTANKWDCVIDIELLWQNLLRIGKLNAAFVFTATQPFATTLITSQPKLFRYDLIWRKGKATGHLHVKRMPMRNHESIVVFYRKIPTYTAQMQKALRPTNPRGRASIGITKSTDNLNTHSPLTQTPRIAQRYPYSVLDISTVPPQHSFHPTQKPVALIEWLIKTYTNEEDIVLDPTCGSGTTAIAAINTGRKWVCIEKDAEYHAVAAKRIAEHRVTPKQGALAL